VAEEARVLEEELRLVEVNIKNTMDVVKTQRATLESLKKDEDVGQGKLQKEAKSMERLLGKRTLQLQRIEECTRNIRELGSLPQEAFNTYAGWSDTKLMKRLEDTNRKLKKYGHVNKKAVEQFTGFVAQRTDLLKRQKEVDEGRKSIEDLIAHLDTKKDMGISRTFKSIALNFTEVFAKLVDGGKGKLTIQTRRTEEQEEKLESSQDSASESSSPAPSHRKRKLAEVAPEDAAPVSSYSGVGIRVSFTGSDEFQSMEQLSGGQQSIVALSLIFAIQKCDPSPFYLFDEIDSNLDTVHREKVASMILKECKTTQFITTTFRPEMLRRADRLYGVVFANRASKISEISREEAQQLVVMDDAQLNAQQQQRAERQTQPDSANSESSTHQHKRRRTTQQQGTSA
jgi:structural maintenance of chromosome 3 (chondroitin sulfate proteoglycan 6)